MDNSKKVLSDTIQSMDRQSILNTIKSIIWYNEENKKEKDQLYQVFRTRYNCSRVREARQYNTMSQEDFSPLEEDENIYDDVLNIFNNISLARVLSALGDDYKYENSTWSICHYITRHNSLDYYEELDFWFDRKLLTDWWSDAYLDDQYDDTIRAILTLISEK